MKAYIINNNGVVVAEVEDYRPQLRDRRGSATVAFEETFNDDDGQRVAVKTVQYQVRIGKAWAKQVCQDNLLKYIRRDGYWFFY